MSRHVTITVKKLDGSEEKKISCMQNESILDAMVRHGFSYPADCGGRGTCGKCRIQTADTGNISITTQDRRIFTNQELKQGFHLACQAFPDEDCEIILISKEVESFDAVTESSIVQNGDSSTGRNCKHAADNSQQQEYQEESYVIGVDLGTTTLAFSLVRKPDNTTLTTHSAINPQRVYGADVISRIKASNEGKREALRNSIRREICNGITSVISTSNISVSQIEEIAIAGNTTMIHLFMGYSCETLGVYPFTPVNLGPIEMELQELFTENSITEKLIKKNLKDTLNNTSDNALNSTFNNKGLEELKHIPVHLLPGISTFVGGDITAGLLFCGFNQSEKSCMLIDLGTNGEMVIGNKDHILVTSTAAGPAFEGGNLSCGVGSILGAISHVSIINDKLTYQTIGDRPPIGICGTGIVDLAAELLKSKWMDETGLLDDGYFETGFVITDIPYDNKVESNESGQIIVTQKDIRELQLAKSAVRAGVEILIRRYGTSYDQIKTVYLAGGFGYKMNIEKAISIGLLPKELEGKIIAVGNSSLAGAVEYLMKEDAAIRMEQIRAASEEIHLSNDEDFNDLYIRYMNF